MKKGRAYQLTGQIGEYLVAVELGRRGFICTTFTQNVPDFDILAIDETLTTKIPIQVKTIRKGGDWQSTITQWMNIELEGDVQKIKGKKKITNPTLIHVLVELGEKYGEDRFFLLRKKDIQNIYYQNHRKFLDAHGGIRPRNPKSTHCGFSSNDLTKFENNWGIVEE